MQPEKRDNMKTFIIILMFIITIYGINTVESNGRVVKVSEVITSRHLTGLACVAVTVITVAFDVTCVYLLLQMV